MYSTRAAMVMTCCVSVCGCRRAGGDAASDTGPPASALKKLVVQSDCAQWAEHGVSVTVIAYKDAVKDCPAEARDPFVRQVDSMRAQMRNGALATCAQHVGEEHSTAGASCFMAATTAKELSACAFAPMMRPGDTDPVVAVAALKQSCGKVMAPP